jgi:hypothetical protein
MRRRPLLATLAALALKPAPASSGTAAPVLVWRADAVARALPDGRFDVLSATPAAAPVVTTAGVWLATRDATVERWRWAGAWRRDLTVALPGHAHALAASPDGGHVLVAWGERLRLLDGAGRTLRDDAGTDLAQRRHGRAAAVVALPGRRSLLAAWPALREWWEIPLDPAAPPIFDGYVHDHRMGEAIARPGHLGIRRVPFDAEAPVPAFAPTGWPWVAAIAGDEVQVVHLDVRRTVTRFQAPGAQVTGSVGHAGRWWMPVGAELWALDPRRWTVVHRRPLPGPARQLAVAGSTLHALIDGMVWRDEGNDWQPVATGVSALADAEGTAPWMAPPPWTGVAAWPS